MTDPSARRATAAVLAVLLTTGWAANHFAAVIPALTSTEDLSAALVDGVFGVYALGLLPGLFFGGSLSDRIGRAAVVLPGAVVATVGTVVLLAWHEPTGLLIGRLVVGIGAGLTIGAGTAWAADLEGATGTVLAGVFLTSGFAIGPMISGLLAQYGPYPLEVPFAVSAVASVLAIAAAASWSRGPARPRAVNPAGPGGENPPVRSVGRALSWSIPMGPWVFASVTLAFVTLPSRMAADLEGPLLSGIAAGLALGTGIVVQTLARRRNWGPGTGVVGAVTAAAGYLLVAGAGAQPSVWIFAVCCVVLGAAYGLCLREGLLDLDVFAPSAVRGTLTGVFYVVTYLGFGLPVLLVLIEPATGLVAPMIVLAVLALIAAAFRGGRLRRDRHPRSPVVAVDSVVRR